ncbi:polysaccharide biosynthesis protein [Pelagerythrobacter marensis]|uniref:Polysaccharide biosynthesis protein CapD n=1 Tax=Pelagerythrobacter marensis TaxID=543877 RepID=A0A0G3XCZ0_9SPHN|nr:nucleoside-diphosphate sugar epimerase/dehydratase [Pelagerythrobacter marensis]AKM08248.1 Polysaccharide biosynthesis protein CapD [Pelagerythrobacter marensis]
MLSDLIDRRLSTFQQAWGGAIVDLFGRLGALPRRVRQIIVAMMDAALCTIAVWIAFSLRLGEFYRIETNILAVAAAAIAIWFPIAWWRGVYRSIVRFSGARAMAALGMTVVIYTLPMTIVFMTYGFDGVPRTVALIQPIVFLALMAVSRLAIRFIVIDIVGARHVATERRVVAIYGAGSAGQQLASSLRHEPHVRVEAFIDDDIRLAGQQLDGITVHPPTMLDPLLNDQQVDEVLLALPSATRSRRRDIIEALQEYPVAVRSLPSMGNLIDGKVSVSDLRDVSIDDLLGREPVRPNELLIGKTIAGKRVMVTGAGGSIGSELCRQILCARPAELILLERSEYALYAIGAELDAAAAALDAPVPITPVLGDLGIRASVQRIFEQYQPQTVFHAAAYKHVPLVEANPIAGLRNNIFGTLNACLAAEEVGVANFVLISTDKAVRPTNVMGASKRVCELILQARAQLHGDKRGRTILTMVRFGNVLGSSGSVVPRFQRQISEGGPVTLTHRDVTRYFMTIPEAAQLVIQAGAMAKGGEVFVLDMGEPVRILDLARSMINLSGMTVRDEANPDGDIEIREVGLRPGEKLYEELLIGDSPEPTVHERIRRANEAMLSWDALNFELGEMGQLLDRGDGASATALLARLVPEYKPSDHHRSEISGEAS